MRFVVQDPLQLLSAKLTTRPRRDLGITTQMVASQRRGAALAPASRRWTLTFIASILLLLWYGLQLPRLRRLRSVREYLLTRPSAMQRINPGSFAILAQMKNEAMGLREWLAHYTWQGADLILLLDNGSTDEYQGIVAAFSNAVVLPAPERYAQPLNFGEIGRPYLEERGYEFVLVTDLDNFFWSEQSGRTMKDLVIETLHAEGSSQFTCPFHHFGSSGFDRQPKSVRECLTKRSAWTSPVYFGSSVVRLPNLLRLNNEAHAVQGETVPCPPGLLNFHYKAQSREYWEKVKLPRGDAVNERDNGYRSWQQFEMEDKTGNTTLDFRLRDALRDAGLAGGVC